MGQYTSIHDVLFDKKQSPSTHSLRINCFLCRAEKHSEN